MWASFRGRSATTSSRSLSRRAERAFSKTLSASRSDRINKELPVIAIRIPHVGELSRKERDDIKPLFVSKGGARVFEDFKRIENKFPEAAAKARNKAGAAADDLLALVVGSAQPGTSGDRHPANKRKVTPGELAIYASAGLLRVALAQKYSDRHKLFQKGDFRFLWVTNFPMFEWQDRKS